MSESTSSLLIDAFEMSAVCPRYFKVLIQEMDLKLDLGFLYAVMDLFTPENASTSSSEQEVVRFTGCGISVQSNDEGPADTCLSSPVFSGGTV